MQSTKWFIFFFLAGAVGENALNRHPIPLSIEFIPPHTVIFHSSFVVGAIAFVSIVGLLIFGQVIPSLQGSGVDPNPIIWTFRIFFGGLVYYYIIKWYRMKHGIDMSLVYKQIPPE